MAHFRVMHLKNVFTVIISAFYSVITEALQYKAILNFRVVVCVAVHFVVMNPCSHILIYLLQYKCNGSRYCSSLTYKFFFQMVNCQLVQNQLLYSEMY